MKKCLFCAIREIITSFTNYVVILGVVVTLPAWYSIVAAEQQSAPSDASKCVVQKTEILGANSTRPKNTAIADLYGEFLKTRKTGEVSTAGERIMVSGVVIYKGLDIHKTPSIELSDQPGGRRMAVCVVDSFAQLDKITVGDRVAVSGTYHIFIPETWGIVLKQCQIETLPNKMLKKHVANPGQNRNSNKPNHEKE